MKKGHHQERYWVGHGTARTLVRTPVQRLTGRSVFSPAPHAFALRWPPGWAIVLPFRLEVCGYAKKPLPCVLLHRLREHTGQTVRYVACAWGKLQSAPRGWKPTQNCWHSLQLKSQVKPKGREAGHKKYPGSSSLRNTQIDLDLRSNPLPNLQDGAWPQSLQRPACSVPTPRSPLTLTRLLSVQPSRLSPSRCPPNKQRHSPLSRNQSIFLPQATLLSIKWTN